DEPPARVLSRRDPRTRAPGARSRRLAAEAARVLRGRRSHGRPRRCAAGARSRRTGNARRCRAVSPSALARAWGVITMDIRPLFLNGRWVGGAPPLAVVNPATAEPFAHVSTIPAARVSLAIDDAHAAFAGWRELTGRERGRYLSAVAAELVARRDAIARTITLENGKPLAQSLGEVDTAADHFQWFAEEARRAYGRVVPPQVKTKRHLVLKSPIGVVGAISPWNFPLVLAARKIAPALAAGCPVILKPASQTP